MSVGSDTRGGLKDQMNQLSSGSTDENNANRYLEKQTKVMRIKNLLFIWQRDGANSKERNLDVVEWCGHLRTVSHKLRSYRNECEEMSSPFHKAHFGEEAWGSLYKVNAVP